MTDGQPVYQVRKVFDPKTMGVREELVDSGEVVEAPAPEKSEATKPKSRTKRLRRSKKKSDS